MEEENVLLTYINIEKNSVNFSIESKYTAEDFSDNRLEEDIKSLQLMAEALLFQYYTNADYIKRELLKKFSNLHLQLKWRIEFRVWSEVEQKWNLM